MVATRLWDPFYVTLKYTMMVDVVDSHVDRVILEVSQKLIFEVGNSSLLLTFLGCFLSVQVVWEPLILVK